MHFNAPYNIMCAQRARKRREKRYEPLLTYLKSFPLASLALLHVKIKLIFRRSHVRASSRSAVSLSLVGKRRFMAALEFCKSSKTSICLSVCEFARTLESCEVICNDRTRMKVPNASRWEQQITEMALAAIFSNCGSQ